MEAAGKEFIEVHPICHYRESGLRGHTQICISALLIHRLLQKKARSAGIPVSSTMALESVQSIKAVETRDCNKISCGIWDEGDGAGWFDRRWAVTALGQFVRSGSVGGRGFALDR